MCSSDLIRLGTRLTDAFLDVPGIVSVSQWAGRAERGADTYGSHYSEYEVALGPMSGSGQQRVLEDLRTILSAQPGISFEANTFLTERIDETISCYTAPIVVNLFGQDLERLDLKGREIESLVQNIEGARGVRLRASHRTPNVEIRLDPRLLVLHGLAAADVLDAVELAYAGKAVNQVYRDNRAVPVMVLLRDAERRDVNRLKRLPIVPGVMPITNFDNLKRFSSKCGAEIPLWLGNRLEDFGNDTDGMRQFGIDVVTELCNDLLEGGAPGIHFYSMNLAKSVRQIWNNLSLQLQNRDA